ncbi:AAA family ATPase [Bradyrhizobium sp. sBnM-33]|nr:AAA family ATPase [Bradyrhizobium sp. sBnM-33]WOH47653.1 AAA family ATPase [Bradyrhizobium sp. sBnM-33]
MPGYRLVTFDEIEVDPPAKKWLIKGILARGETSAWIAPPGAMKSALLAEATICVGAGLDWHGYRNKGAAGVVYFAIERADLVKRRLRAHRQRLGLAGTPICVSSDTIDLTHPEAFKKVIDTIRTAKTILGADIGLVIIDTFAKLIAAAGGDENSAKDQGAVFANVQRVKNITGVHVALIGHTGKDESRGARGSNALLGDVDVMVTIGGEEIKTVTVTKANDAPEGQLFSFKSEVHDFGVDDDGDPITVNIVSSEEVSPQAGKRAGGWSKGQRLVRDCLNEALMDAGTDYQIPGGPIVRAVAVKAVRALHNTRYVSNGDGDRNEAERKAWSRNFKTAREAGLIGGEAKGGQEWIWIIP